MEPMVSESVELSSSAKEKEDEEEAKEKNEENNEENNEEDNQINIEDDDSSEESSKGEKAYYLTKVCIHLKNYEDSMHYADEMCKQSTVMTKDKIKCLLAAYSQGLGPQREAWRKLTQIEKDEKVAKKMINEIKVVKEKYILKACDRLIKIINNHILTKQCSDEETVLFNKIKADHYRYMAEVTHGQALYINKQNAFYFYKEAHEKAKELSDLNATKLNVALNYSVFLFEILNKRINSFFYAKEALYKALKAVKMCSEQELTDDSMRDTLMIIEVLNMNVEEWYKEELGVATDKGPNDEKGHNDK